MTAAKASQPKGTAEITYDPAKISPEAIAKAITEKTSFKAEVNQNKERCAISASVSAPEPAVDTPGVRIRFWRRLSLRNLGTATLIRTRPQ